MKVVIHVFKNNERRAEAVQPTLAERNRYG